MPSQITSSETQVNTHEAGGQITSQVTKLSDGGFLIAWNSIGQDGSGSGVYAQRYDAGGNPVGNEFRVHSSTAGDQYLSEVEGTADGGFLIAWMDNSSGSEDFFLQRYDAAGNAVGNAVSLPAIDHPFTYGDWHEAKDALSIQALDDGRYFVTWTSAQSNVMGQLYGANDQPIGSQVTIKGNGWFGKSEVLANGNIVLVYQEYTSNRWDVFARHYNPDTGVLGSRVTVNTTGAGDQGLAQVDVLSDGGYVIVWQSDGQDGDQQGIYGQRFNASGNKVGGEFIVNTTTSGDQRAPDVTALDDGGFLVRWTDRSGNDGDSNGIFAQRFDASGNRVGDDFVINETTAGSQYSWFSDSLATLNNGSIVVTWETTNIDSDGSAIAARVLSNQDIEAISVVDPVNATPASALDANGGESQVNTNEAGGQSWSQTVALSDGGFIIAWNSIGQDGSGSGVYAQRYDAGGNPVGNEFRVHSATAGDQYLSEVEGTADGGFLIAWMDNSSGSEDFFLQRYDAAGNAVGNAVSLPAIDHPFTYGDVAEATDALDIQALADGRYVVSWTTSAGSVAQLYGANDQPIGSQFTIEGNGWFGKSEVLANGNIVFIYQEFSSGGRWDVFARHYNPDTEALGNRIAVNNTTGNDQQLGQVTALSDGGYVVVWQSAGNAQDTDQHGIVGQRFDASGNKVGGEFIVNTTTSGDQRAPDVTALDDGGFLVRWTDRSGNDGDNDGIYAQRFDANGNRIGNEFVVNETIAGSQYTWFQDTLTTLSNGSIVATWQSQNVDSDGTAITARVLDTRIFGSSVGTVIEDDDPDSDGLLEVSGSLTATEIGGVAGSFTAGTVAGTYGSVTIDASGNWSYAADNSQAAVQGLSNGESLTDVIIVTTIDGVTHDITITINGVDDSPVAGNVDLGADDEDSSRIITVAELLANSSDADTSDTLSVTAVSVDAASGAIVDNGDGTYTFTPVADFNGDDVTISFTVSDGSLTDTATAVIDVTPVNDAPVADAGTLSATEDGGSVAGTLVASDVDGDSLNYSLVTGTEPAEGSVTINPDGSYSFDVGSDFQDLAAGATRDVSFDFEVTDGNGGSDTATITVTVTGVNDAAVIAGDTIGSVTEDVDPDSDGLLETAGTLTVTDADAGEASFTAGTVAGTHGSLTIDAAGSWTYVADNSQSVVQVLATGESLTDTITVTTADGTSQQVTITINGANDSPVAGNVDLGSTSEDTALVITEAQLLASSSDVDTSDTLSVTSVSVDAASGSVTDNGDGTFTFTPVADFVGDDVAISFTVSDGTESDTATAIVDVTAVADAPTSGATTVTTDEDTAYTFTASDFPFADVDAGDSLQSVRIDSLPVAGSLGLSGSPVAAGAVVAVADIVAGNLVFTPEADGNGSGYASFSFSVSDGSLFTASPSTLTIDVTPVNDAPVITSDEGGDTAALDIQENNADITTVVATDVDGDTPTYSIFGGADAALFQIDANTGELTFVTAPDFENPTDNGANNDYEVIVRAEDGNGASDEQTITVTITDDPVDDLPPLTVSISDAGSVSEGGNLVYTVSLNRIADQDVTVNYTIPSDSSDNVDYSGAGNLSLVIPQGQTTATITVPTIDDNRDESGQSVVVTLTSVNEGSIADNSGTGTIADNDAAPTISISDPSVSEGGTLNFNVSLSHVSERGVTVDASTSNGSASSNDYNATSGTLSFGTSTSQTFSVQTIEDGEFEGDETLNVTLSSPTGGASIADGSAVGTINNDDPAPPPPNLPHVIVGTASGSVGEDSTSNISGNLNVSDPESQPDSSFSWSVSGASFGSVSVSSTGTWTYNLNESNSAVQNLDTGESLTDTFVVTAADGTHSDGETVTITILGADEPGTPPDITNLPATVTRDIGDTVIRDVNAVDAENDAITFSLSGNSAFSINASTGLVTVNNFGAIVAGQSYTLSITASDDDGSNTEALTVIFNDPDEIPVITSVQSITVNPNTNTSGVPSGSIFGDVDAFDPDGGSVSYSIASFGNLSGILSGGDFTVNSFGNIRNTRTSPPGNNEVKFFRVRVTDDEGNSVLSGGITSSYIAPNTGGFPPIVFDLDGDGVELVSIDETNIFFDITGNGVLDRTGWIGGDDGILVLDRNGNGQIDNGAEISFLRDVEGATSDLEGLAAFDTNGDGLLTSADAQYGDFQIWQDINQDGISQSGELFSLSDLDIESIDLNGTPTGAPTGTETDNFIINNTTASTGEGGTIAVADVALIFQREINLVGIDLNGDGLTTTDAASNGITLDVDFDGTDEAINWIGSDDGILVFDHNANGVVDSSLEIGGIASPTLLAQLYDDNSDSVLDDLDSLFENLYIWQDANGDGVSQSGELLTLSDVGISAITINDNGTLSLVEQDGLQNNLNGLQQVLLGYF